MLKNIATDFTDYLSCLSPVISTRWNY